MPNLLFLCGGRRVGLLRRFRQALAAHGGGRVVVTDTEPRSAASLLADAAYTVPPCAQAEAFADAVARVCAAEAIDAVVPLRCAAVAAVPMLRARLAARVMSGDDHAVAACGDKARTAALFVSLGLPTPCPVTDPGPADLPLFVRRRTGEGSAGAGPVRTPAELAAARARDPGAVFTPLLHGREFTVDAYKDLSGRLVSCVPRERLAVRAGEVERAVLAPEEPLRRAAERVLQALSFTGPATVQAILHGGVHWMTEVNLRYGGGVTLSMEGGAPSHQWLARELAGGGPPEPGPVAWGLGMSRYDEDVYFQAGGGR